MKYIKLTIGEYMQILTWIFSIISLYGTVLNSQRNKWGQALWIVPNLFWFIYDFKIGAYAQGTLFFIYFVLAIVGIIKWKKKENQEAKK